MFQPVRERVIIARSSSPHQTVEVETPFFFADFTAQCNEQAIIGNPTDFGRILQPAKRQTKRNLGSWDFAREGRSCKKIPLIRASEIPKSVATSDLRIGSRQSLSIRGFFEAISFYFLASGRTLPSSVALDRKSVV